MEKTSGETTSHSLHVFSGGHDVPTHIVYRRETVDPEHEADLIRVALASLEAFGLHDSEKDTYEVIPPIENIAVNRDYPHSSVLGEMALSPLYKVWYNCPYKT